jgi:ribosome assembly protein 1
MAAPKNPELGRGGVLSVSASKQMTLRLRVVPMPEAVTEYLTKHVGTIKQLQLEKRSEAEGKADTEAAVEAQEAAAVDGTGESHEGTILSKQKFREGLEKVFKDEVKEDKELWKNVVDRITAFGPRRVGPNILVDATAVNTCEKL